HLPHRRAGDEPPHRILQPNRLDGFGRNRRQAPCRRGHAGCGLHLRVRRPTMAKSPFSKRDEKREITRRALIKWSVAAGAALGVSRSKVFEILEKTAGKDVARAAAANPTTRSVHLIAGNGGAAWFQLLWPHNDVAAANNGNFAWHRPGESMLFPGTDKPLTVGPDTPFRDLPATKQMTVFQCGANETHTANPTSVISLNGNNIISVASALQAAS